MFLTSFKTDDISTTHDDGQRQSQGTKNYYFLFPTSICSTALISLFIGSGVLLKPSRITWHVALNSRGESWPRWSQIACAPPVRQNSPKKTLISQVNISSRSVIFRSSESDILRFWRLSLRLSWKHNRWAVHLVFKLHKPEYTIVLKILWARFERTRVSRTVAFGSGGEAHPDSRSRKHLLKISLCFAHCKWHKAKSVMCVEFGMETVWMLGGRTHCRQGPDLIFETRIRKEPWTLRAVRNVVVPA